MTAPRAVIILALILVALSDAFQLRPPAPVPRSRLLSHSTLMRIPIVDDVLDYLTNKGGYIGFTEEQLKGDVPLTEADTENFGQELQENETVTTVFVIVLILVPFIVGYIAYSLDLIAVPSYLKFAT